MSDPDDLFQLEAAPEILSAGGDPSFFLTAIDVFNWGPFHGRHHAAIDPHGTAIIGPTGSGKTTLVDALMTLLVLFPKYNLASTGGHESDRDLISYVRGASGGESTQAGNGQVARPAKTLTGLSASYSDGRRTVTLGGLLWVESASNAAEDLKKVWFFARDLTGPLDTLLTLHHENGKTALVRHARDTVGLRLFTGSKKEYLAHVRGFFEVGENAFNLLNRAAGLKQINSIDQIFRELVLDNLSAFDRALEVAKEFETLRGIYEELQAARQQRDSLLPVRQGKADWEKVREKLAARRHLKELLPVRFAEAAVRLWQAEEQRLSQAREETDARLQAAEAEADAREQRVRTLHAEYLRLGGADIQNIEALILDKEKRAAEVRKLAGDYQNFCAKLGLRGDSDKASFEENRKRLPEVKIQAETAHSEARQKAVELAAELKQHRQAERSLADEIREVEARPNSNIPAIFQTFRELLAAEIGVASESLLFLAEMVEVKAGERHWQGAIERAIGPERLRLLVPAHRLTAALAWVNGRDNRLHVRLQSADPAPPEARFFDDGFIRKLSFRDHPLRAQVKFLLARRDRHCVASPEILHRTENAMTVEGSMSDRDGRFEKQDQRPLTADWMTGFDNRHLLASLRERHQLESASIPALEKQNAMLLRTEMEWTHKLGLISSLENLDFARIDIRTVEGELQLQRQRLADLTRPDSDAGTAKTRHDQALRESETARAEVYRFHQQLGSCKKALESATRELDSARDRCGDGLAGEDRILAEKEFPLADITLPHQLTDAERTASQAIDSDIRRAEELRSEIERRLVRAMANAKSADTGALAEAGTELRDLDAYLQRLETLEKESLPEKLQRFLDYLNQSSGQGVTQLLANITNDVALIQERVQDLNATLSRVDFRHGQFLQLHVQSISHPVLQQMDTAQKKLRQVGLTSPADEGEPKYRALGEVVRLLREAAEKPHTLGSQALLDPRHRLQFAVVEVDRATGRNSGARKGSQTGSGGEKEMMASYILTASLSYALCPVGASMPRYASIVLDEAFSKSSPAAASRIIEALRAFGLHPLFVTPNKEISLLKAHTRSAILVHNKNRRATLTSLGWEQIDAHAQSRKAAETSNPTES